MKQTTIVKLIALSFVICMFSHRTMAETNDGWSFDDSPLYEDELNQVNDPYESFNRVMFKINDAIDKMFLGAMAAAYKKILPEFVQKGGNNFVSNLFAPVTAINYTLQGDCEHVAKTIVRFFINTIFGFLGAADVAAKLGIKRTETSLGDTFKKWGMKPGPYLVLPILGPGSVRGVFGRVAQMPMEPVAKLSLAYCKGSARRRLYYVLYGVKLVDQRAQLHQILTEIEKTSVDVYAATRNAIMSLER